MQQKIVSGSKLRLETRAKKSLIFTIKKEQRGNILIIWHTMTDKGVSDLWSSVNHIAIVVSDVGTSLSFYTDIIGMKQVFRPNFDR